MGGGQIWRIASCFMFAFVCLTPALCFGWDSNLFLFGTLGVLLGSLSSLVLLSLSCGGEVRRAIPALVFVGVILSCASAWFLIQPSGWASEWIPSHWIFYVPLLGRLALCATGAVAAFCLSLTFWDEQLVLRPSGGAEGSLLFGLLMLCFSWGLLLEGFWFFVWVIPADQILVAGLFSAVFAVCLYGVSAFLCRKASAVVLEGSKGFEPILISLVALFFAAGQLSWGLINRLWGTEFWSFEVSLVCLVLILFVDVFAFVRLRCFSGKPSCGAQMRKDDEPDKGWLAETFGLSDREAQAVSLAIKGMTSEESAEKMGVKAPTVRTYLQRAYKKAEVRGLDDLACKIAELRPSSSDASVAEIREEKRVLASRRLAISAPVQSWISLFLLFSFFSIIGLVLVPRSSFFGDSAWRVSQIHSQLVGLVLALAGGFVFLLAYVGARPRCFYLVAFALSASRQRIGSKFYLFLALVLFASLASSLLWFSLVLFFVIVFAVCSVLLGLSASAVNEEKDDCCCSQISVGRFGSVRIVALFILFAMCGYAFEDAWRPATDDFTWWIQAVFLAVLVLYLAAKVKDARLVWPSLFLALLSVVALGSGVRVALLALVVCFWFFLVVQGKASSSSSLFSLYVAVFGLAMLASRWLTDAWWDQMSYGYVSAVAHGGLWIGGAVVPAIEFLLVVAALGSLVCLVVLDGLSQETCSFEMDESGVSLYFASRGLTPLESDVLSGLAQGKTGTSLAQELHYAVGTINVARWSAFRKLGIHNRGDLVGLLEQNGFASGKDGVDRSGDS
ncbi:MAG: helix-turn-helix transcriptional regulator [Coriobacteriia bacterium]|nr:helix-turn-helix transcriptional regulator [Coriobacteriia bacterium]